MNKRFVGVLIFAFVVASVASLLLYRLLPDSRGNIHLSLAQEYERLVTALERHLEESDGDAPQSTAWQEQLAEARAALFPNLSAEDEQSDESPFRHAPEMVEAVQLALLCSLIERPLSLDLLLRAQSSRFLRTYQAFSRAMAETALQSRPATALSLCHWLCQVLWFGQVRNGGGHHGTLML